MARRGKPGNDTPSLFDLPLAPPTPETRSDGPAELHEEADEVAAPSAPAGPFRWGDEDDEPELAAAAPAASPAPESPVSLPLFGDEDEGWDGQPAPEPDPEPWQDPDPDPDPEPWEDPDPEPEPEPWGDPEPAVPLHRGVTVAGPAPLAGRFLGGLADLAVHLAVAFVLLFGARLLGVEAGFDDWPALAVFVAVFSFLYTVIAIAFWGRTPGMTWASLVTHAEGGAHLTFPQAARRWLGGVVTVCLLGLPALLAAVGEKRSLADRLSGSVTWTDPDLL
jgi:uncharacterized RDD family membrane protein YckC